MTPQRRLPTLPVALLLLSATCSAAFSPSTQNPRISSNTDHVQTVLLPRCQEKPVSTILNMRESDIDNDIHTRRSFGRGVLATVASTVILSQNANAEDAAPEEGFTVNTLKSGVKYIDIKVGTGSVPRYGNLLSMSYKGYVKIAPGGKTGETQLQEFHSQPSFLMKHGSGRMVRGLDDGLHTMREGGVRRIIIPPKLGYVTSGVGPVPGNPISRWKLNKLLNEMVEARGGQLIFDVELKTIIVDEADQGYYEDTSISQEDFETVRVNVQKSSKEAKEARDNNTAGQQV